MVRNYLFIVEGEKDEKTIFRAVLERLGFNPIVSNCPLDIDDEGQFQRFEYSLHDDNVVIIQGPRNRIHDFLKLYDEKTSSIERLFHYDCDSFRGIFLFYDIDHNDNEDIEEMQGKFLDESSGMLLLNSPSIEVLGDFDVKKKKEDRYSRIKEYKSRLNAFYEREVKRNVIEYIAENFEECALFFLYKNAEDFKERNVMEHPLLLMKTANALNERHNEGKKELSYVIYRYYSTVAYVAFAYINNLTKEIDNLDIVASFFKKRIKEKAKQNGGKLPILPPLSEEETLSFLHLNEEE